MEGTNPVNKKLAAALSGGAVLVLALSGCSSDDSDNKAERLGQAGLRRGAAAGARRSRPPTPRSRSETSDNSKPAGRPEDRLGGLPGHVRRLQGDRYRRGQGAGPPPVDDGEKKQQEAVKELNTISASYADLKKQVDGLDTKDQAKFADGLKGVADQLDKLSQSGDDALKKLQAGDVGKAMAKQESCKSASTSPSASKA